ncbi:drug/metabolite transporter superfamily protein YnfA [Pseudomonas silensiensis]|nr:drug/metabolite transporter superfamily protein YnfA [Pseudomonas silensiensis]
MNHNPRSRTWFRLAALYFAIGVMLGVAMGASGDHSLFAVHAHINLLGWVSMALFGIIGTAHPAITEGRVAAAQFWIYNVGVPLMLGALTLRLKGFPSVEPLIGVASLLIGCSVLLFVWLVFSRIGVKTVYLSSPTGESRLS